MMLHYRLPITKEGRELESHAFLKARTQSERAILIARKKSKKE